MSDSEIENEPSSNLTKRKRKCYTIADKIAAIRQVKVTNNLSAVSRELNIDRKTLREWVHNESELVNMQNRKKRRRIGGGRKPFFPQIEEQLYEWFKSERLDKKCVVNYRRLREKALEIAKTLKIENFIGSHYWIYSFCRRHKLCTRKITHVGQYDNKTPEEKRQVAIDHLAAVEALTSDLTSETIFNMDETPVFIDMISSSTISFKGESTTETNTTGYGKTRFTVILLTNSSGAVFKTMVILKGLKKCPKCVIPKDIVLKTSKGGLVNTHLMLQWIDECLLRRSPFLAVKNSLLLMDNYGSHKKEEVIEKLKLLKTKVKFIPPKTTHYLQPLDVGVNSAFKSYLKYQWEKWYSEGEKEFTKKGYRKRPNWNTILNFISNAVKEIKKESIIKSFKSCGVAEKGQRVEYEELNEKLKTVLMGITTEDADITNDSEEESDNEETIEVNEGESEQSEEFEEESD
jgi:transposase-like protein